MTRAVWMLCVALFVVVVALATVNMYARWHQDQYFGEIIRMDGSGIVLRDARVGELVIHVSQETAIVQGRGIAAPLVVGDHLIVFGKEHDGHIEASLIRIVVGGAKSGQKP